MGRYFPRKFGDLIIWLQILEKFKDTVSLFFVTDDEKEDWWHTLGGKKIGPRRELREEAAFSGIRNVFFQTVSGFLHLSNANGETDIQPDSEELARRLSQERLADSRQRSWRQALRFEFLPELENEVMLLLSSDNLQHTVQLETIRRVKDLLMRCLDILDTGEGVDGIFVEIKWSGAELLKRLLLLEREEFPDPRFRVNTCHEILSLVAILKRRLDDSFVRDWGPPPHGLRTPEL